MIEKKSYYLTPLLLALIIFFSNFMSVDIFDFDLHNFAVWFVLWIFAFACGWLINKTLGYNHGGKIVFAVVIASVIISLLMVSFFNRYFEAGGLISDNIILYTLRDVSIGAIAIFGMAVSEVILLENKLNTEVQKNSEIETIRQNAQKEADLIVGEAKLNASEIILEAKKESTELFDKKTRVEKQLRGLIIAELELIKKYENKES